VIQRGCGGFVALPALDMVRAPRLSYEMMRLSHTGVFGDMKWIGEHYKPDLLLIPIGGHFVMSPEDAAVATRDLIKPKFAVPMHYGTFPPLKGTPQEYLQALGTTPTKVFPINPGDKLDF